jgi:hypothetical protein
MLASVNKSFCLSENISKCITIKKQGEIIAGYIKIIPFTSFAAADEIEEYFSNGLNEHNIKQFPYLFHRVIVEHGFHE